MMDTSDYVATRGSIHTPAKIKRPILISSILGRFVRRCRLEYIKLDFGGEERLWILFKSLRAPSIKDLDHVYAESSTDEAEAFGFQMPDTHIETAMGTVMQIHPVLT